MIALNMENKWINEIVCKPPFGVPVMAKCRIYGEFIATNERIDPEYNWGNWKRFNELGIMPPTHWRYL